MMQVLFQFPFLPRKSLLGVHFHKISGLNRFQFRLLNYLDSYLEDLSISNMLSPSRISAQMYC